MKAVILAGGLGERIRSKYPDTIKSLIEFNKKPFIYYQLELLKRNGFKDVVICAGYGATDLVRYLSQHDFNMNIVMSHDGKELLGTGGAIKKALPHLNGEFMVLYGDSYLDFNYKQTINKFILGKKLGLMTIFKNEGKYDKSNVRYSNGKLIEFDKEKFSDKRFKYIDYGANFFKSDAFKFTQEKFDLSVLQTTLLYRKELDCDVIKERFYEIGSLEGIEEFRKFIGKSNVR
jgi:NDP-sugar pyrophosphorylase family protein